MTWTYGGDPSANSRDYVRFLVGDTDTTDQQVSDEEIAAILAVQTNSTLAAARICDAIAATYARQASTSNTEGLSVVASVRMKHYLDLAKRIREQSADESKTYKTVQAKIAVGGRTYDQKDGLDDDSDLIQPNFRFGQDDYRDPIDYEREDD